MTRYHPNDVTESREGDEVCRGDKWNYEKQDRDGPNGMSGPERLYSCGRENENKYRWQADSESSDDAIEFTKERYNVRKHRCYESSTASISTTTTANPLARPRFRRYANQKAEQKVNIEDVASDLVSRLVGQLNFSRSLSSSYISLAGESESDDDCGVSSSKSIEPSGENINNREKETSEIETAFFQLLSWDERQNHEISSDSIEGDKTGVDRSYDAGDEHSTFTRKFENSEDKNFMKDTEPTFFQLLSWDEEKVSENSSDLLNRVSKKSDSNLRRHMSEEDTLNLSIPSRNQEYSDCLCRAEERTEPSIDAATLGTRNEAEVDVPAESFWTSGTNDSPRCQKDGETNGVVSNSGKSMNEEITSTSVSLTNQEHLIQSNKAEERTKLAVHVSQPSLLSQTSESKTLDGVEKFSSVARSRIHTKNDSPLCKGVQFFSSCHIPNIQSQDSEYSHSKTMTTYSSHEESQIISIHRYSDDLTEGNDTITTEVDGDKRFKSLASKWKGRKNMTSNAVPLSIDKSMKEKYNQSVRRVTDSNNSIERKDALSFKMESDKRIQTLASKWTEGGERMSSAMPLLIETSMIESTKQSERRADNAREGRSPDPKSIAVYSDTELTSNKQQLLGTKNKNEKLSPDEKINGRDSTSLIRQDTIGKQDFAKTRDNVGKVRTKSARTNKQKEQLFGIDCVVHQSFCPSDEEPNDVENVETVEKSTSDKNEGVVEYSPKYDESITKATIASCSTTKKTKAPAIKELMKRIDACGSNDQYIDNLLSNIDCIVHRLIKEGKLPGNNINDEDNDPLQMTLKNNTEELLRNISFLRAHRVERSAEKTLSSQTIPISSAMDNRLSEKNRGNLSDTKGNKASINRIRRRSASNLAEIRAKRHETVMRINKQRQQLAMLKNARSSSKQPSSIEVAKNSSLPRPSVSNSRKRRPRPEDIMPVQTQISRSTSPGANGRNPQLKTQIVQPSASYIDLVEWEKTELKKLPLILESSKTERGESADSYDDCQSFTTINRKNGNAVRFST
ncbi:unnamed protein product [Pseudo-nitzschia multistriata]|uniref:Uncharacterized protein n=1 Tax=Pseudo-nitzschia multistriata TaxID=183589 RepID=A0A448YWH9_9STRA|nr:unnamed protein product [Pseudo-nitzschia multistriata]